MKPENISPVLLLACATVSLPSAASVATLNPVADAFVTTGPAGEFTANNYGGAGALSLAASGSAKGTFQSLLRFDLSGTVAGFDAQFGAGLWKIDSVSLTLTSAAPNNAIFNSSVAGTFGIGWMQNDAWVEGAGNPSSPAATGVSFSSLPSLTSLADASLGSFAFNGSTSGSSVWNLALAAAFAIDLAAGGEVTLTLAPADSSVSYLFNSRSFGTVASRPLLSVNAVAIPEPGTLGLLSAAAAWFVVRRNRHETRA